MDLSSDGGECSRMESDNMKSATNKRKIKDVTDNGNDECVKAKEVVKKGVVETQALKEDRYTDQYKGPYGVWIRYNSFTDQPFNIYKVGKIVMGRYKSIKEIKKDGRYKDVIFFEEREEANKALKDEAFKNNRMIAFIPGLKKNRKGVLRGIPTDMDKEEILSAIKSSAKVESVTRLNRRNKNSTSEQDKWIPTSSVLACFTGDCLPREVSIYYVKTKVNPYVRKPMQCFNCFLFGHMATNCRNKQKCSICGEIKHEDNCQGCTPRCANCKGAHKSFDSACHIYAKNKAMNELMAFENISYNEARTRIFSNRNIPRRVKDDFPSLKEVVEREKLSSIAVGISKMEEEKSLSLMDTRKASLKGYQKGNQDQEEEIDNPSKILKGVLKKKVGEEEGKLPEKGKETEKVQPWVEVKSKSQGNQQAKGSGNGNDGDIKRKKREIETVKRVPQYT